MDNAVCFSFGDMLRMQELGFHTVDSLYTHPDRILPMHVFIYVVRGKMQVWEAGKEYIIQSGEFLFLKAGLHHWGDAKTPAGTSWYWAHFYMTPGSDAYPAFSQYTSTFHTIAYHEYNRHIPLPKQGSMRKAQMFESKLDAMNQLFNSTDPFRAILLSIQTMQLLLDVYKESVSLEGLSKSDRTVQRVIDYLEHKETHGLNSKDIENQMQMNYTYLCRVFKQKTKNTIHNYNTMIFINKAMKMMRDTQRNVSEISDLLGFSSPFYFSRIFKATVGCTPSEYISKTYAKGL